jgi:DNA-binding response OmpR family regulator
MSSIVGKASLQERNRMKTQNEALRELQSTILARQKLSYNDARHLECVEDRIVDLTPTEYRLWRHLFERAIQLERRDDVRVLDHLFTRVEELEAVTGLDRYLVLRHVRNLKEKFQVTPFAIAGNGHLGFVFLKKPEE